MHVEAPLTMQLYFNFFSKYYAILAVAHNNKIYIRNATATILPTVTVPRFRPAPVVAYFSSRGPGGITENILKVFFSHAQTYIHALL